MTAGSALTVQDGYYNWTQSLPTKTDAADKASFHRRFLLNTPTRKSLHRQLIPSSLSKRVKTYNGLTIRILLIVRKQRDRRKSCSTSKPRNGNSDGSMWPTRSTVGPCDGLLLLLATRARQRGQWQRSLREQIWCNMYKTVDPVRSKRQLQTHVSAASV